MLNIFKIKIPKENAQEVTELESWTVSWMVATSIRWGEGQTYNKAFIKEADAKEFQKQLEASAALIKTAIRTNLIKN